MKEERSGTEFTYALARTMLLALIIGVLLFGVVAIVLIHGGMEPAMDASVLVPIWAVIAAASIVGSRWFFRRATETSAPRSTALGRNERARGQLIASWMLAEAPAFVGMAFGIVASSILLVAASGAVAVITLVLSRPRPEWFQSRGEGLSHP